MRITVHERGGCSVFGGSYNPKADLCVAETDQQQTVTIDFPSEISALARTNNGLTLGDVTLTTNRAVFTIAGTGSVECIATMGSERPRVEIKAAR